MTVPTVFDDQTIVTTDLGSVRMADMLHCEGTEGQLLAFAPVGASYGKAIPASALPERITLDHVKSVILSAEYVHVGGSTLTLCILKLKNGCHVTGESAAILPSDFNVQVGQEKAYQRAVEEVFQLESYLLRQRRFEAGLPTTL